MPARAEILPLELEEHFGWVIIFSVLSNYEDFRYRPVGTLLTHNFLGDATDLTFGGRVADIPPNPRRGADRGH